MQEISSIVQKKDVACSLIKKWGFHASQAKPPQIYPDLYENSGTASLCVLVVDTNCQAGPVYRRHHLLGYELAKLFGCKVSVSALDDFINKSTQEKVLENAISLLTTPQEIIAHYNKQCGEHYKFSAIDIDEELADLGFSDAQEAEEEIQQLKQTIADTETLKPATKTSDMLFFQSSASVPISANLSKNREEECELLLRVLKSNPLSAAILEKNVDILLEVHQKLSAAKPTESKSNNSYSPTQAAKTGGFFAKSNLQPATSQASPSVSGDNFSSSNYLPGIETGPQGVKANTIKGISVNSSSQPKNAKDLMKAESVPAMLNEMRNQATLKGEPLIKKITEHLDKSNPAMRQRLAIKILRELQGLRDEPIAQGEYGNRIIYRMVFDAIKPEVDASEVDKIETFLSFAIRPKDATILREILPELFSEATTMAQERQLLRYS